MHDSFTSAEENNICTNCAQRWLRSEGKYASDCGPNWLNLQSKIICAQWLQLWLSREYLILCYKVQLNVIGANKCNSAILDWLKHNDVRVAAMIRGFEERWIIHCRLCFTAIELDSDQFDDGLHNETGQYGNEYLTLTREITEIGNFV